MCRLHLIHYSPFLCYRICILGLVEALVGIFQLLNCKYSASHRVSGFFALVITEQFICYEKVLNSSVVILCWR